MVHFDYEKVKGYFDNDTTILKGFLALLKKELPKSQNEIEARYIDKDPLGIMEAAHKLKGTGLSGGLPVVTEIAAKLNKLDKFDEILAGELIAELKKEISIILTLIDEKSAALG